MRNTQFIVKEIWRMAISLHAASKHGTILADVKSIILKR